MGYDVLVVGGGLIGLSCAYQLALEGARVAVVERESPEDSTSTVAAGMLIPSAEADEDANFLRLGLRSRDMWPGFAESLRAEGGIDPELVVSGVIQLARDEDHAVMLRRHAKEQTAAGNPIEWLAPDDVAKLAPGLSVPTVGGIWCPDEMQVQPGRAVAAVAAACRRRGVDLLCGRTVLNLEVTGDRVTGVVTQQGRLSAGTVVLAAGAYSRALAPAGLDLPVFPAKGQDLTVQVSGRISGPWIDRLTPFFIGGVCYFVPKRDGTMVLGATEEFDAGFDRTPSLIGAAFVSGGAVRAFPGLAGAPMVAHKAGLRPATPDTNAILGPAPGFRGLILATGHYRNGILLAPVTGQAVADWAAGRPPQADLAPFALERFGQG